MRIHIFKGFISNIPGTNKDISLKLSGNNEGHTELIKIHNVYPGCQKGATAIFYQQPSVFSRDFQGA